MGLDPEEEKDRLNAQLLKNPELRLFVNDHEKSIDRAFETMLIGNRLGPAGGKLSEEKQRQIERVLMR